ncbi:MAG: hypothetical protein Ct9H300mP1_24690 [Planctomycetaceae bacterium]|nr:MAG: hypothetical protein Ct9H300mP1_24690 [Planctomycetaceae bacterium]
MTSACPGERVGRGAWFRRSGRVVPRESASLVGDPGGGYGMRGGGPEEFDDPRKLFKPIRCTPLPPFLGGGQFGFSHHPPGGIGTGPGCQRGRALRQQIAPDVGVAVLSVLMWLWTRSVRTWSPSRNRYRDVSSSQACDIPPGECALAPAGQKVGVDRKQMPPRHEDHSASVSRLVRRAARSRFGMFDPCPLSRMIFLNPW